MTALTDETEAFDLASDMENPICELRNIGDILLRIVEGDSIASKTLANSLSFITTLIWERTDNLEAQRDAVFHLLHKHREPLPPEARIR